MLGKKDNWKQTTGFTITVTEETTSGSEDSEDEVATPPSPPLPPPLLLGKALGDLPPPVMPPLSISDLGLQLSPDFKPRSLLIRSNIPSLSPAGAAKAPPETDDSESTDASGVLPPAKCVPEGSKAGDLAQEDTVMVEAAAPVKVGNSIKSSSLRLPQRRGARAQGSVGSSDHMEVGAAGGKGKEPVEKQGVCVCACVRACVRAHILMLKQFYKQVLCVCTTVCGMCM